MKFPALISIAVGLAGCTVNGKPVGFGGDTAGPLAHAGAANGDAPAGSSPAGSSPGGSSPDASSTGATTATAAPVAPPPSACRAPTGRGADEQPPFLDRPADPWLAVKDGQPVPMDLSRARVATRSGVACDARHDHCLRDCSWFVAHEKTAVARPHLLGTDGAWIGTDISYETDVRAYRTVPATRRNLKVGVTAVAVPEGARAPEDETAALDEWRIGTVESIDWAAGTVRLGGEFNKDPYYISATRVAVLRYQTGGKVEAIAGMDPRAPTVDELVLPAARAAGSADPWAQVDSAGQPRVVTDETPLTSSKQDCASKHDHCLRPWTWFVETDDGLQPLRWGRDGWVSPVGAHVGRPTVAYRTRPARPDDLHAGQRVITYRDSKTGPANEAEAYDQRFWAIGEIETVERDHFRISGDYANFALDNARVPVLWWLPGEKAAAVE
ncbi:MAG: hypothetical protein IPL61_29915 [Myxococcales bacterium]|nr:hypothetical protein [Myxococcales bacterium]